MPSSLGTVRRYVVGLTLLGWAWAGVAVAAGGSAPSVLGATPIPCPTGAPFGEVEGETVVCGQISVPQNWSAPDGIALTITYAVLRSKSTAPFADPVLYFEGGPGASAITALGKWAATFAGLRAHRDVIIWDQRGTTFSSELFCPEDVRVAGTEDLGAALARAEEAFNATEFTADMDPAEAYAILRQANEVDDIGRCRPFLEAQGIDLTQYSTENTVLDALALMDHLGYPAYNLYGISYGTTVTLEILDYLDRHEDADLPVVRSAVIDGVFPLNLSWAEEGFIRAHNVLRVFTDCEADDACGRAYPDIRDRAVDLLAKLDEAPLTTGDGATIGVGDLVEVLSSAISSHKELLPFLPRIVAELEQGTTETFELARGVARWVTTLPSDATASSPPEAPSIETQSTEIADQLRSLAEQVELLGLGGDLLSDALVEADTRPELFIGILQGYVDLVSLGRSQLGRQLEEYVAFPEKRTREGLASLAALPVAFPVLTNELASLADRMSDEEVVETYRMLTSYRFLQALTLIDSVTNRTVDCNDRGATIFMEPAFASYRSFEAPSLLDSLWQMPNYRVSCERLGLAAEEYVPASEIEGATSSVRTLVVNGSVDPATPVEWGEIAFASLENARMVTIPLAAHGASTLSQCGMDVVTSFVLDPAHDLDLSCVEALRPDFVSPTEPLPDTQE